MAAAGMTATCWCAQPLHAQTADALAPVPTVTDGAAPGTRLEQTDLNLTRRAGVPEPWNGEVAIGANSAGPGNFAAAPNAQVTGRVGLGYGLALEVGAHRMGASQGVVSQDSVFRPSVGVKWNFAGGGDKPYALTLLGAFRPEGFTEPEGELELHLLGSYKAGRTELHGNLTVGGEPEGEAGDAELHMAVGYRVSPTVVLGVEEQSRVGFGSKKTEVWGRQEHVAGPSLQYKSAGLLVSALVGGGVYQPTAGKDLQGGGYGMVRLGWLF